MFILAALFVFEIFLSWLFGYIEKRLDSRAKRCFKIYDVTDMITNKLITQIAQYPKKSRKFGDLIKYSVKAIFFCQKSCSNRVVETSLKPLLFYQRTCIRRKQGARTFIIFITLILKRVGRAQFDPICVFFSILHFLGREKTLLFVTFNSIIRRTFPENFIVIPWDVQEIWRFSSSILGNFIIFLGFFDISLLQIN